MPASKRRRAATRAARAVTAAPAATDVVAPVVVPAVVADGADAHAGGNGLRRLPWGRRGTAAGAADTPVVVDRATPARGRPRPSARARPVVDQRPWGRVALLLVLALVLVVEMIVGLVSHYISHRSRLILVDVFFFNSVLALPAALLMAPLVKLLTHQQRHLRFLESLSLGAVYALTVTLITLAFLHPTNLPANATADQLMDALHSSDVPGLVLADVMAMVITVQVYPALNRLITRPGRGARERLEARTTRPDAAKRGAREPKPRGPRRGR